ncbi:MAG: alpha-hydroxy-acid oxidizing protein [Sulfitobacter sp.]
MACGVGAGRAQGVERALEILQLELVRALGQLGISSIKDVGPSAVTPKAP